MGLGRGLGLSHQRPRRESAGGEGGASRGGAEAPAGWVLRRQSAGCRASLMAGACARGRGLGKGGRGFQPDDSASALVCTAPLDPASWHSGAKKTNLAAWGSRAGVRQAWRQGGWGGALNVLAAWRQAHRRWQRPRVRLLGLVVGGGTRPRPGKGERLWRGWRWWGRGAPQLLSEAGPGGAGVGEVGGDHPVALGALDHVADLPVELQQLGADQAEVLAGAHQGDGARLAQRLVAEVDVEQRLDLAL